MKPERKKENSPLLISTEIRLQCQLWLTSLDYTPVPEVLIISYCAHKYLIITL